MTGMTSFSGMWVDPAGGEEEAGLRAEVMTGNRAGARP
jgi:hypothetical protein